MRKRFFLHSQHICQLQLNDLAMPTDKEISERIRDLTDQGVCKAKSVKAIIDSSNNIPSQRFSPSLERISALIQYNQNRYCQLKFILPHLLRMYVCMYINIYILYIYGYGSSRSENAWYQVDQYIGPNTKRGQCIGLGIRYSLISLANSLSNMDVGASPASTCSHISSKSEE